jgi:hypothetical protein
VCVCVCVCVGGESVRLGWVHAVGCVTGIAIRRFWCCVCECIMDGVLVDLLICGCGGAGWCEMG